MMITKNIVAGLFCLSSFSLFATEPQLVYSCSFDSAAAVTAPAVGPSGTCASTVSFVSGKVGQAMKVPAYTKGATVVVPAGTIKGASGTIEFWGKIDNSANQYGTTGDPVFIKFYNLEGHMVAVHIGSNNGVGGAGVICFGFGGCATKTYGSETSYAGLFANGEGKGWHHYAYVWDKNTISGIGNSVALYVDNVLVGTGAWGADEEWFSNNDFEMYAGGDETSLSGCTIDELKIWDGAKTSFDMNPQQPTAAVSVSAVTAKQHYPWCGKVDIGYTVAGSTDGLQVKITVKDNTNDKTYEAKTFNVAPTAAVGTHTVVWDATADGVTTASQNMVATVSLIVPAN